MQFQEETTAFRDLLGDTPKIRVLEYLLEGRELDHSLSDIAEGAGINRITLFRMWKGLEKAKAVMHTRNIGNAKLFRLNLQNSSIKKLAEMFDKIINEDFKKLEEGKVLTINR